MPYGPTLSSIFGADFNESKGYNNFLPASDRHVPRQLFGLRRLAKNLIIGSPLETGNLSVNLMASTSGSRKRRINYLNCVNGVPHETKRPKTQESKIYSKNSDDRLQNLLLRLPNDLPPKEGNEFIDNLNLFNNSGNYGNECHQNTEFGNKNKNKNITDIVINDIPLNTGLESILNQIYGGSIAKVEPQFYDSDLGRLKKIEIKFVSPEGAQEFMKYGCSNLFKVNGIHLNPQWTLKEDALLYEKVFKSLTSQTKSEKVCRCLILKKYPTKNNLRYVQISKQPPLDTIDVIEIRRDFEKYGPILDITPVISRKLCISIIFYDILSAMKAMQSYEDKLSYTHEKYYKSWAIWYGKDLTDRPAIPD